jgi:probable rRNA maturation factor
MSIEIANESGVDVDESGLIGVSRHVLDELGVNPLAELSILIVDLDSMSTLHERWMGEPGPTDVLAFPMDELDTARGPDEREPGPALLGDVVLCPEVARRQAAQAGHSVTDELHLLCTHGVLHLLGYDHAEADEEREMFALQAKLLDGWRAGRRASR